MVCFCYFCDVTAREAWARFRRVLPGVGRAGVISMRAVSPPHPHDGAINFEIALRGLLSPSGRFTPDGPAGAGRSEGLAWGRG